MKPRLLYLTITIYFLWLMRLALSRTNPRAVLAYQPITTLYYLLGATCLLVQIYDYAKQGNKDE